MTTRRELRGVAFAKGERIVAVCLDHYMVVSCGSWEELPAALNRMIDTHVAASIELGRQPFEGLSEAPQRYWELYHAAVRSEQQRLAAAERRELQSAWRYLPPMLQIGDTRLATAS